MKAKQLPVYKEAQRLVSLLHESTRKAPRDLRHTLVQKLLTEAVELMVDIDTANKQSNQTRVDAIQSAQQRVARLDVLLFVSMEQRCLSRKATIKAMQHVDGLGKQLYGWSSSAKNQVLRTQNAPELEPFK